MTIGVGKLAKNANQGVRASNNKLRLYRSKGKGLEIFSQENVWFFDPKWRVLMIFHLNQQGSFGVFAIGFINGDVMFSKLRIFLLMFESSC